MAQSSMVLPGRYGFLEPTSPLPEFLNLDDFQTLDVKQKETIFRRGGNEYQKATDKAVVITSRLCQLAPSLYDRFVMKPDAVKDLTMRLWCPLNGAAKGEIESYICLSYCCDPNRMSKISGNQITVPISPLLFSAFQAQRPSARCGIWVDQLCIAQDDAKEKATAIGAMDTVYRYAKLVVIILQDVQVHLAQQRFLRLMLETEGDGWWRDPQGSLRMFADDQPFFQKHALLARFVATILESRYFSRAWCAQELQTGFNFAFCMPCQPAMDDQDPSEVFWFSSDFLAWLLVQSTRIPFPPTTLKDPVKWKRMNTLRSSLIKILTAESETRPETYTPLTKEFIDQRRRRGNAYTPQPLYTEVTQEIFSLSAGGDHSLPSEQRASSAFLDKMSLVLNIIGNGLRARRRPGEILTEETCIGDLHLLGIAAGDAVSFCTMGKHLDFSAQGNRLSWLQSAGLQDYGCGPSGRSPLPPIPSELAVSIKIDPSPQKHWIITDCFALGLPMPPQEHFRSLAKRLVTRCLELKMGRSPPLFEGVEGIEPPAPKKESHWVTEHLMSHMENSLSRWGPGPEYQFWYGQTFSGHSRTRFELAVACILECGLTWILGTALKCGFPAVASVGKKLISAFPQAVWNDELLNPSSWDTSEVGRTGVNTIMSLANWCVDWGCVRPYGFNEEYMPVLYPHGVLGKGRCMVFYRSDRILQAVLPCILFEDPYSRLYRIWLLEAEDDPYHEKMTSGGGPPIWFIRGKSILFTDVPSNEIEYSHGSAGDGKPGWRFRPSVTVHAPPQFVNEAIKKHLSETPASETEGKIPDDLASSLVEVSSHPTKSEEGTNTILQDVSQLSLKEYPDTNSKVPIAKTKRSEDGSQNSKLSDSSTMQQQKQPQEHGITKSSAQDDDWGWASRAWQKQKKPQKK